ncbi:MAG TPA: hypothetical protein VG410_09855, partial [Solirubrobacteraceae bacterium]|nr:hypothetical protein [Solirubrobacteraceae bacterium]
MLLLLAVGTAIAGQLGVFTRTPPPPPHYAPWPIVADPNAHIGLGVVTSALAANWAHPWSSGDLNQVNTFEHLIKKHVEIVMYFADWAHTK